MRVEFVPIPYVDSVWNVIRPGMARACEKGGGQIHEGYLRTLCRSGQAYLTVQINDQEIIEGAAVVQENHWPTGWVLEVIACSGPDMEVWVPNMINYAKEQFRHCTRLVFEGREGWKAMPGVRVVRHVYEMDLNDGQQEASAAAGATDDKRTVAAPSGANASKH
jgi:hypothetical protein